MKNPPTPSSISPDAMRSDARGSTALAKRAIGLLEKQIFDEFGYRITMGAEVEFVVKAKQGAKFENNPLDLKGAITAKKAGYEPSSTRPDGQKDMLYPNSPYVCYSYVESTSSPPFYKYEVVVSHKGTEAATCPATNSLPLFSRSIRTADVIETTIADLHRRSDPSSSVSTQFQPANQLWQERVESVSTRAFVNGITNGLHINVNLVNDQNPDDHGIAAHRQFCGRAIGDMASQNLYLLGTTVNDYARYKGRAGFKKINLSASRIENTIPSAASNPYYAVMLTLAGTLKGLREARSQSSEAPPVINATTYPLNISAEDAKTQFFAPDNELRAMMNSLDITKGSLGDQFFVAVEKTPPHTEPRLYSEPGRVRL